jgi:hypothetical protein
MFSFTYCVSGSTSTSSGSYFRLSLLISLLLTCSMEQRTSWEANRFSASQEIPQILWNPKIHYRIHKCTPPVSILSQVVPVHNPHPTSWRFILILSSHLRLGLPSGFFPHQNPVYASPLPHTRYMPRPSHFIDFINRVMSKFRALTKPTNALFCMNIILLYGDHRHVSASHVAIVRVVSTKI